MNKNSINSLLFLLLFLIPMYLIAIFIIKDQISHITYPIAIYFIGLSLLLMHGLTSNYINGRDVHQEYLAFRVVSHYLYWDMGNFNHVNTACLSTSILPTIYWSVMGIDKLYVYKVIYQILWAFTPLVCYIVFNKYTNEFYSFIASLFFIFQMSFIYGLQSAMRTEIAILLYSVLLLVLLDDEIEKVNHKIILLILLFGVVLSHYSTAYIMLLIFIIFKFSQKILSLLQKDSSSINVSSSFFFIAMCFIFIWYGQTKAFSQGTVFVKDIILNMTNFYAEDLRYQELYASLSGNVEEISKKISSLTYWTSFFFIAIGVFDSIKLHFEKKSNFDVGYLLLALICAFTLVAFVTLPLVSKGYGADRTYQLMLVILAIFFPIGGKAICKYFKQTNFSFLIISFVLILQFFCGTFFLHNLLGLPSEDLGRSGDMFNEYYIFDSEVSVSKFLDSHIEAGSKIYCDKGGGSRLLMGWKINDIPNIDSKIFTDNKSVDMGYNSLKPLKNYTIEDEFNEYIYLRRENVVVKQMRFSSYYSVLSPLEDYEHILLDKNLICNSGSSEVFLYV